MAKGIKPGKKITWLHLSDWHQKGQSFDRAVVLDALLADIRNRLSIAPDLRRVDFVVFSGDIAYHGRAEEFEAARRTLLDPVLEALELPPGRLFLVPGNHDLNRDLDELLPGKLQRVLGSVDDVNYWITDEVRRSRALELFADFSAFAAKYTGQTSPDFGSRLGVKLPAATVHLLGLNTAWMSGRYKGEDGEVDDERRLVIGEPQIHQGLKWLLEGDLRIVVQHHPFEWIARFDREQVEARICESTDFVLWGHEHSPSLRLVGGPVGDCIMIPAGATYDRRRGGDHRYVNAYNFTSLDLDSGRGAIFFRRWSEKRTSWISDTDTAENGSYSFALPKRVVNGGEEAASLRIKAAVSDAGKRYRSVLLRSCDIIDRDYQEFCVRAGIMRKKETSYGPTQTTSDSRHAARPIAGRRRPEERVRSERLAGQPEEGVR